MRYPAVVKVFIEENVKGTTTKDLVKLVNERFGTEFTVSKMKSYKSNYKLKSETPIGLPKGSATRLYAKEVQDFIRENVEGKGPKVMAELLNETFGTKYTKRQIKAYYGNRVLDSGMTGYFPKGHIPPNKGKKGYCSPGCEKGWFKKGHIPDNYMPVGAERVNGDGYVDVKIEDPNKWKGKHVLTWEEHNGPVPEGHVIILADGNKLNTDISNLILVTRKQLLIMNKKGLIQDDADLTKTGVVVAELFEKIYEKQSK
jgi:hypothetical protein